MKYAPHTPFLALEVRMLKSVAWQSLSLRGRDLFMNMWLRFDGKNVVAFGKRDAEIVLGCGSHQAVAALRELQDRLFIVIVRKGFYEVKTGLGRTTEYRLTNLPYLGQAPTNDYLRWRPTR